MRILLAFSITIVSLLATASYAADYMRNPSEVHNMLDGATLKGTYLRTQSPYSLNFNTDGILINQRGEKGRWWVNQQGQYCRVWATGRLQGNMSCLDLAREGDAIAIYSKDKRVAEGVLVRE